jgi:hypothetical protein
MAHISWFWNPGLYGSDLLTPPCNHTWMVPDTIPNDGIKYICIVYNLTYQIWLENSTHTPSYGETTFRFHVLSSNSLVLGHLLSQNDIITSCLRLRANSQPPQTAAQIPFIHIRSVWAHWYAAHGHKVMKNCINYNKLFWTHPYTVIPKLLGSDFRVLGHLWSQNDIIMSWLRLTATSN